MISKILEALQNQSSKAESSVFDGEAFRLKLAQATRKAFRSMSAESKQEFLTWLSAVRSIRNSDLKSREKEEQLSKLPNAATAYKTLKAVLEAALGAGSAQDQNIVKEGLAGIGFATALMSLRLPPAALVLLEQVMLKFLLIPQFEMIASFLEQELQAMELIEEKGH